VCDPSHPDLSAEGLPPEASGFDQAARRVFTALQDGDSAAIGSQDLETIVGMLRSLMRRYGLSEGDAADGAQEVALSVIALGPKATEVRNPAAYLTRLAQNRAVDELRRSRHRDVMLPTERAAQLPSDDDAIAALLEANATADAIRRAMRAAIEAQDHLALRVVSTWLDAADELGKPPPSREVARRAGVSHTSVNQALKRFRSYFPAEGSRTS
jgi:DNA-directed RNA polymerase specialized sigma24 family protein